MGREEKKLGSEEIGALDEETKNPEEQEVNILKAELEKSLKLNEELKDKWLRSAAEFDNFRKRNANLRLEAYEDGKAETIKKILGIGDNLERALKLDMDEKTKEGIGLIYKSFLQTLSDMDVLPVGEKGEEFDPNVHEAVMQAESGEEDSGKISEVFLKGYKQREKVIRYAQVAVFK